VALSIVKIRTRIDWAMLVTAAVLVLSFVWLSAKWNFANALSTRADRKEIADLAVDLAPSDPQTRFAAAAIYRRSFDTADQDRSLAEYERVAALSPDNYLCWLELGHARERSGDQPGAEIAIKRALDLAPNYADVQWAYGNTLLRAGKADDGFVFISSAARANTLYTGPAVVTTLEMTNGSVEPVRQQIGDSPAVNSALATYLTGQKRFDEAVTAWELIPADLRNTEMKEAGTRIASSLLTAKQYRLAARVYGDVYDAGSEKITAGKVFDGGFENGVKLTGASGFEWQISAGTEPQIAISQKQHHGGANSLLLVFNTMLASDFRGVLQTFAGDPSASYEFEAFYRSELKAGYTVRWEIVNAMDGSVIVTSDPVAAISDWNAIRVKFTMPTTSDGVYVTLVRDRCPSTVCAINGSLWFDDISIRKL